MLGGAKLYYKISSQLTGLEKPELEVAPATLLLIYSFQFRSAFQPAMPLSRLVVSL